MNEKAGMEYNPGFLVADDASRKLIEDFGVDPEKPQLCIINFINNHMRKYHYEGYNPQRNLKEQLDSFLDYFIKEDQKQSQKEAPKKEPQKEP